jgi:hypothetical protein
MGSEEQRKSMEAKFLNQAAVFEFGVVNPGKESMAVLVIIFFATILLKMMFTISMYLFSAIILILSIVSLYFLHGYYRYWKATREQEIIGDDELPWNAED